MSRAGALLSWLEDASDLISPIVVKEVRQIVRGREFNYAFAASLVAALSIAFFGAADALTGAGTSGRWTFYALITCLSFLGLAIVPLGAFSALRNERMEQTLELITLTSLSPLRIVIGKLLAQAVKLVMLFAAMAPFVAMSFLLGGIDFVTILVWLVVLFMCSVWACAACLFLSTLLKSRAMSGVVFGAAGVILLLLFTVGRAMFFMSRMGGGLFATMGAGAQPWWVLSIAATICLATLVNLVLLAENRLSLVTEDRVTRLRVGFLAQFLLILAWMFTFLDDPAPARIDAVRALGVIAGVHLALVAMFTVTEDLVLPRRVVQQMAREPRWRRLLAILRPGGGRGALYVLVQMLLLLWAAWLFHPPTLWLRWIVAICSYVCFFTGLPALVSRGLQPAGAASLELRVAVLVMVAASMVLPDVVHYAAWRPDVLDLRFSWRHLVNPIRTLANWPTVESQGWFAIPFGFGSAGLLAYLTLMHLGRRMTGQSARADAAGPAAATREPDSAGILY